MIIGTMWYYHIWDPYFDCYQSYNHNRGLKCDSITYSSSNIFSFLSQASWLVVSAYLASRGCFLFAQYACVSALKVIKKFMWYWACISSWTSRTKIFEFKNKSCSRSEACFVCSMNYCYCCDYGIHNSKSHVSSQCLWVANVLFFYFLNQARAGLPLVSWNCFCLQHRYVCVCVHAYVYAPGYKLHSCVIEPVQPSEQVCCI